MTITCLYHPPDFLPQSKLFESLLRFSDIRTHLVENVVGILKECEGQNVPKEDG